MVEKLKEYKGQTEIECSNCGKKYITYKAWLKKYKNKYHCCSNKCRYEYHKKYANTKKFKQRVSEVHKGKTISKSQKLTVSKKLSGKNNPSWKGGVTYFKTKGNYVGVKYIRCPKKFLPMARKDGYVMEHRIIMAKKIRRCLLRKEVVHHKDHNPTNNSIDNLVLYSSNKEHKKAEGKTGYFKEYYARKKQ